MVSTEPVPDRNGCAQNPRKSSQRWLRAIPEDPGYLSSVAQSAMCKYLARVVREARESAGRKAYHIAAAQPGERSLDPSTVYRFEHEQRWPRNPDLLMNLYAADLDIAPIELWARALDLWRADDQLA